MFLYSSRSFEDQILFIKDTVFSHRLHIPSIERNHGILDIVIIVPLSGFLTQCVINLVKEYNRQTSSRMILQCQFCKLFEHLVAPYLFATRHIATFPCFILHFCNLKRLCTKS